MTERPRYVIINDIDAPQPNMVAQYVTGTGYCYLDRRNARFDGMRGHEAIDVRKFGFSWVEDTDGVVRFYRNELAPTATYSDGESRRWKASGDFFEWPMIKAKARVARSPLVLPTHSPQPGVDRRPLNEGNERP